MEMIQLADYVPKAKFLPTMTENEKRRYADLIVSCTPQYL
jgi:hypothetical protein